jgi:hypothetical protein
VQLKRSLIYEMHGIEYLEMDMVHFVLRSALGPVWGDIGEEFLVDIGA